MAAELSSSAHVATQGAAEQLATCPMRGLACRAMATSTSNQRMTKPELAKQLAATAGLTGEQARTAVDAVFDTIAGELAAGGDVAIAGFGKFSVADRAAREGRNPATGQTIQIAASRGAKFSTAAALKSQLNG